MLKLVTLFCLLAISLNFLSCKKGDIKNMDTISYGTSFGMCIDYCRNTLSIENEKITFTKSKNGPTPSPISCTNTLSTNEVAALKELLEKAKISSLPKTIGCPDCADGGAEWVSVSSGAKEYKVVFEYGSTPKELTAIVAKFRDLKERFKNCN